MSDYVKTRIVREDSAPIEDVYNIVDTSQPIIGSKGMFYRIQGTLNVPSGEATLYRVTDENKKVYIAKHYRMKIKEEAREKMLNFLTNLKENSSVMPILDHGEYFNTPFDILPYFEDKDLSQKGPMDVNFIKNIFLPSMNSALNEIHKAGIVHRDIKPENLFYVQSEQKVYIGDFGIASNLTEGSTFKSTEIGRGTVGYLGPEVKNNNVHIKTDYYALGVTIVCLIAGKYIFKDMSEPQIYQAIINNTFSECIKDRRLRILVRGLTIGDVNARFDGRDVDAYIHDKALRVVDSIDKSREARIDKPYNFEKQGYYDIKQLALAMSQNWDQALEHLKRGLIERHFSDVDPEIMIGVQKILEDEDNIEYALTRVLYFFNSDIGICYQGKTFEDFKDIAKILKESYPNINEEYRGFIDNGVLLNLAKQKYSRTKKAEDDMTIKFLQQIYDIGNKDLAYYYFILFQCDLDEMPPLYIGDMQYNRLDDLGAQLLKVPSPTSITRVIANSPCCLAYLGCYVGLPSVIKIASDLNIRPYFEVHLQILKILEQQTQLNFNRIAYCGFGRWLLENSHNYSYVGKDAKAIQKKIYDSRMNFKNGGSFKLSDYSKLIDQMEENVREFIANFNYNLINKSNDKGIFAKKNEYYLALEYEGEMCCLAYKKEKTNVNQTKDASEILINEIDKCIGITNRNINRINNIVERNSVLRRKRDEEALTIRVSRIRLLSYLIIAAIINAFAALLYLGKIEIFSLEIIKDYMAYSVYGMAGLFDLFFILAFFNTLHVRMFLNSEDKQYRTLNSCLKALEKTKEYFQNRQKDIGSVANNFLRNKKLFNDKLTQLDYSVTFNKCETFLSKHQNIKVPSVGFNHFINKTMFFFAIGAQTYFALLFALKVDKIVSLLPKQPTLIPFAVGLGLGWIISFFAVGFMTYKKKRRVGLIRNIIAMIISLIVAFGCIYGLTMFL